MIGLVASLLLFCFAIDSQAREARTEDPNVFTNVNTFNHPVTMKGTATLEGATTISGAATLSGAVTVSGALTTTGEVTNDVLQSAEHGAGAIGTYAAPATYRRTENGEIITTIKIDLTGLDSSGTENDVIGLADPGTGAAYIGRNVVATNGIIYKVEVTCLEVPTAGDADILFVQGSEADETFDDTVANTATIADGTGDWTLGQTVVYLDGITANYYYYMTQGATDNAAYTAGQFLIKFYGHPAL